MRATLFAALALAQVAFAQTSEDELRPNAVSGPPLLVQAAIENAKSLGLSPGVNLTYHFVLFQGTPEPASVNVKRGDAFDRFFLRMFGLKTEKVVRYNKCVDGVARPNDVKVAGDTIEIWINAGAMCAIAD